MYLQYILYNSRRCACKKWAQRRCIYPLLGSYSPKTSQGVPLDSLGVGAVEIRCIIVPDHRRHRQEAPKRVLGNATGILVFSCWISTAWGPLVSPLFVPGPAL